DPAAGRFRDYLRAALIHLVTDYYRERQAQPQPLPADMAQPLGEEPDSEVAFLRSWREELLNRTWDTLAEANPTYHAVLALHVDNPEVPAPRKAELLTDRLGKCFTATQFRVILHRARAKFADLLLDEVAHSLGPCTEAELVQELRTLQMLKLCVPALERRKR